MTGIAMATATAARPRRKRSAPLSPVKALAAILRKMSAARQIALADDAGVPRKSVGRLALACPVKADHVLKIFAAAGVDPITLTKIPTRRLGDLHLNSLGIAVGMRRLQANPHSSRQPTSLRKAAKAIGVRHISLYRMETGDVTSIGTVLTVCRHFGIHPFDHTSDVSRESAGTPNRNGRQGNRSAIPSGDT